VAVPDAGWTERARRERTLAVAALVERRLDTEPALREWFDAMSDEQSRLHEGEEHATEGPQFRAGLRYFHAWRVDQVRRRLGPRLPAARILDVGDTDGLMLRHLGKAGTGFNISPVAIENIRANGVDAVQGDGHGLPFEDASFDAVLCFETLEHVENPAQVLDELARVVRPDGRVFVSIPWVPRTFIHPRHPSSPRGHEHIFEFCRDDFAALVTHTALELRGEAICDLLGRPRTPAEVAVSAEARVRHLVAGMFHRFQFFELAPRPA
jgi:SAM-dependent methyltransferase